jgi:hypothetical protein
MFDSPGAMRGVKNVTWLVLVCCWLVQALAARHTLDADGVAYLNMVDSALKGNWHALVNGWWSPGYPFLLTLWFKLFRPSPFYVPLAVRLFAVVTLLAAFLSFEFFLKQLFFFRRQFLYSSDHSGSWVSDDSIRFAGYGLFLWITVFLTPAHLDQPDILVFILYLLASGVSIQLASGIRDRSGEFAIFGMILGLAYLVKAVMFPLSFAFFAGLLVYKKIRQSLPKLFLAVAVFAAVCTPQIVSLSRAKGRLTYADVGILAYRHVMDDDEPASLSAPAGKLQNTEPFAAAPHIEEYTSRLYLGVYPPWADASFGYTGSPAHFNLRRQLNRIHVVWHYYFELYGIQMASVLCGFLVLLIYSQNSTRFTHLFLKQAALWFPALCGFILYGMARVEGRFLAGFTVAFFASGMAALTFLKEEGDANDDPKTQPKNRVVPCVVAAVTVLLVSQVTVEVGHQALKLSTDDGYPDWQVAQTLASMGVKAGDRVSYLGDGLTDHVWAYLGHVSIAAEIPLEDVTTFWAASADQKQRALAWLAARGARVLVTCNVPDSAVASGWKRVGHTRYYILDLPGGNGNPTSSTSR